MGNPRPTEQPTEVLTPSERLRFVRERFEAAWRETAKGGQPPDLGAFLQDTSERERAVIRDELERINRRFQSLRTAADAALAGDTVDLASAKARGRIGVLGKGWRRRGSASWTPGAGCA